MQEMTEKRKCLKDSKNWIEEIEPDITTDNEYLACFFAIVIFLLLLVLIRYTVLA